MGVGLVMYDINGENALTMMVNDVTGGIILTLDNRAILTVNRVGPSLTFRDINGKLRAAIGAIKARNLASGIRPESSIVLYNENRTLVFRAP